MKPIFQRTQMALLSGHNFPVALLKMNDEATLGPEHLHTFYELVIITGGSGVCKCGGKSHPLKPGNVFLVPPGEAHAFTEQRRLALLNVLWDAVALPVQTLDTRLFQEFVTCFRHQGEGRKGEFALIDASSLLKAVRLAEAMAEELNSARPGCLLAAAGHLCSLIAFLSRCYADCRSEPEWERLQMEKALNYLELHYPEEIGRDELARMLHISAPTFYRRLLGATGMTFREYLQRIRLSHAENLLRNTSLSITEIAHRTGFSDSNHFTTQFHRRFGVPPRQYRRERRTEC
ncbi:MAG: helix-turn-helix domain-containing protein [Victivallales bacterium]|nr:helix-turn-helix domain-containing protein [Victivallales bacterium]